MNSHDIARLKSASYALAQMANATPDQHKHLYVLIVDLTDAGESREMIAQQVIRFLADIAK